MKLFQKLIIAPAVLGLFSPLSASANELSLDEMSGYSSKNKVQKITVTDFNPAEELAITNHRVDSLNENLNNFEAGSFSETTSMSGSASFQLGAVNEGNLSHALTSTYSYSLDLNSSLNGDDNLYVGIETGNAGSVNFVTDDSVSGSDSLSIHSIYYQTCCVH